MVAISLGFFSFLVVFTVIGALAWRRKGTGTDDYLLASRSISPWLAGLSAVSTTCSGFMFIGLIGTTWKLGVYTFWFMIGIVIGNYATWRWLVEPFRRRAHAAGISTIPQFIAQGPTGESVLVRRCAALAILIFLGLYAAAQLNAGSKALDALLGIDARVGATMGAAVIALYCFAGGIRASIWTDTAQSLVMVAAMVLLCWVCLADIGGPAALLQQLAAIDPDLATLFPEHAGLDGTALFFLTWVVLGVGVLGQPHIMIRALTVASGAELARTRRIYFSYYGPFLGLAITCGLCCRVLLPEAAEFDAELALPLLAGQRLPGFLVGVILAGIFSATISTADSQVLSCSAALSNDLRPCTAGATQSGARHVRATLAVTAFVLVTAMWAPSNVFSLVLFAWGGLAAAFAPLMTMNAFGRPVRAPVALTTILGALATALVWRSLGWHSIISEILPAFVVAGLIFLVRGRGRRTAAPTG